MKYGCKFIVFLQVYTVILVSFVEKMIFSLLNFLSILNSLPIEIPWHFCWKSANDICMCLLLDSHLVDLYICPYVNTIL